MLLLGTTARIQLAHVMAVAKRKNDVAELDALNECQMGYFGFSPKALIDNCEFALLFRELSQR